MYKLMALVFTTVVTAAGWAAAQGTNRGSAGIQDALRESIAAVEHKQAVAVDEANTIRSRYGLGPLRVEYLHPSARFERRWQDWLGARNDLLRIQRRLQTAEAMTPEERDTAARLYVPTVVVHQEGDQAVEGEVHDGAWLLRAMRGEHEVAADTVAAAREALGISDDSVELSPEAIQEIENAERAVLIQLEIRRLLLEKLALEAASGAPGS